MGSCTWRLFDSDGSGALAVVGAAGAVSCCTTGAMVMVMVISVLCRWFGLNELLAFLAFLALVVWLWWNEGKEEENMMDSVLFLALVFEL